VSGRPCGTAVVNVLMNPLTHLWFGCLVFADRLLGTHLVERELARQQRRVEAYEAHASVVRRQMAELDRLLYVTQVQLCALYLRQRCLLRPEAWLRFAPSEGEGEERGLDLLIGQLVKHGLATIRTEAVGEHTYVYHLRPDWGAMADLLSAWEVQIDPLAISWLEEMRSNKNGEIHH
jgi:hypothetical protein